MDIKECYEAMHGDYEDIFSRLRNNALIIKLVKKFESDQSYAELKQGLADKDVEKAFRAAHTLKGICLNLGFDNLFAPSQQLTEKLVNITEILRAGQLEGTDELFSKIQTTYENTVAEIKKLD